MHQFKSELAVMAYRDGLHRFHSAQWRVVDTSTGIPLDCLVNSRVECDRHANWLNKDAEAKEIAIEMLKAEMKSPG